MIALFNCDSCTCEDDCFKTCKTNFDFLTRDGIWFFTLPFSRELIFWEEHDKKSSAVLSSFIAKNLQNSLNYGKILLPCVIHLEFSTKM